MQSSFVPFIDRREQRSVFDPSTAKSWTLRRIELGLVRTIWLLPNGVLIGDEYLDYVDPLPGHIPNEISAQNAAVWFFESAAQFPTELQEQLRVAQSESVTAKQPAPATSSGVGANADGDSDSQPPATGTREKDEGATLAPSRQKAYGQYLDAVRRNPELANATDRDVYDAVKEQLDSGETLPSFATWTRYLRDARDYHDANKSKSRAGREHGKSVVRRDEI
jgi:hypothetical protein